jgi:hypothetical protein
MNTDVILSLLHDLQQQNLGLRDELAAEREQCARIREMLEQANAALAAAQKPDEAPTEPVQ